VWLEVSVRLASATLAFLFFADLESTMLVDIVVIAKGANSMLSRRVSSGIQADVCDL
jgi:hypothetical protein